MTSINQNQLYQFIVRKVGTELDAREAKELGIDKEYTSAVEDLDIDELDIDEVLDNKDLYEQFATLYVEEKDKKQVAKDKETEKEEQRKVQDKNEAGV